MPGAGRSLRIAQAATLRTLAPRTYGSSASPFLPPAGTTAVVVYDERNWDRIGFDSSWVSALPAARLTRSGH